MARALTKKQEAFALAYIKSAALRNAVTAGDDGVLRTGAYR